MKQEDKELLLKDLCGRLPYGVIVATTNLAVPFGVVSGVSTKNKVTVETKHADIVFDCTEVKPYLRPMSSMTEEEKIDFRAFFNYDGVEYPDEYIDWLNKKMFDYRGLIEKGLAIEVSKENNPYKNNYGNKRRGFKKDS